VRYVHLNPVRIGPLGLSKADQARQRSPAATRNDPELVRRRLEVLRDYRWSSHNAYLGRVKRPGWLETDRVLGCCGKGTATERRRAFRRYVEDPIREGLVETPWARLVAGAILGSEAFVERVRRQLRGDRREQKEFRGLTEPGRRWEEVVAAVEAVKGEKWESFQNRHGDWGRDAVLYAGMRCCTPGGVGDA
jgi:hypothetical protein